MTTHDDTLIVSVPPVYGHLDTRQLITDLWSIMH